MRSPDARRALPKAGRASRSSSLEQRLQILLQVDLGAQWLHQGLTNPLRVIAQQAGYTTDHDAFPRVIYKNGQPLGPDDPPPWNSAVWPWR